MHDNEVVTRTDFGLLLELVPDIAARLEKDNAVAKEIKRRAVENENGYRPLHWMQGCM